MSHLFHLNPSPGSVSHLKGSPHTLFGDKVQWLYLLAFVWLKEIEIKWSLRKMGMGFLTEPKGRGLSRVKKGLELWPWREFYLCFSHLLPLFFLGWIAFPAPPVTSSVHLGNFLGFLVYTILFVTSLPPYLIGFVRCKVRKPFKWLTE